MAPLSCRVTPFAGKAVKRRISCQGNMPARAARLSLASGAILPGKQGLCLSKNTDMRIVNADIRSTQVSQNDPVGCQLIRRLAILAIPRLGMGPECANQLNDRYRVTRDGRKPTSIGQPFVNTTVVLNLTGFAAPWSKVEIATVECCDSLTTGLVLAVGRNRLGSPGHAEFVSHKRKTVFTVLGCEENAARPNIDR